MDFSNIIVVHDIEDGRCSQLSVYMNHYEYQRSRSFIDLRRRSLRFNIFKLRFLGNARPIETIFHVEPSWHGRMKVSTNGLCHMTKMAAMTIYDRNLENLLLWNKKADDLECWFVALGARVLPSLFNDDPGLTLTYFMEMSNLVPLCFFMRKSQNNGFFRNCCSLMI